jgi:Spy/CpxP family protein refolding chaperone
MTKHLLVFSMAAALGVCGVFHSNLRAAENDGGRPTRGAKVDEVRDKLGLSDGQMQQLKQELVAEKDAIKEMLERLKQTRTDLRDVIQKADATEPLVRAAAAKVAEVEADAAVLRMKLHGRVKTILTEEQREKVKEMNASLDGFIQKAIEKAGERLNQK